MQGDVGDEFRAMMAMDPDLAVSSAVGLRAERDALKAELLHEKDRVVASDRCAEAAVVERDEAIRERDELLEAIETAYGLIQTASSRSRILRARDLLHDAAKRIREAR